MFLSTVLEVGTAQPDQRPNSYSLSGLGQGNHTIAVFIPKSGTKNTATE